VITKVLISPLEGVTEPAVLCTVNNEPQLVCGERPLDVAQAAGAGSGNETVKVEPTSAVRDATGLGTSRSQFAKSLLLNAGVPPAEALGAITKPVAISTALTIPDIENFTSRLIARV
jgi:hypothetical protein